jgi:hypothetical protein
MRLAETMRQLGASRQKAKKGSEKNQMVALKTRRVEKTA